ncbi:MAG: hypothetical protein KAG66_17640, partial [Methylococcales bacterium]|nr:hypothetical protein [Methylococcales bacterium]
TPSVNLVVSLLRYRDSKLSECEVKAQEEGPPFQPPTPQTTQQVGEHNPSRRDVLAEKILVIAIQEPGANAEDYKHMISNCYMLADEFIQQGEGGQADDE